MHDRDTVRARIDSGWDGPPWPLRPRDAGAGAFAPFPEVLRTRGAVSWYVGSLLSLFWLVGVGQDAVQRSSSTTAAGGALGILAVYGLAYVIGVPLGWGLSTTGRGLVAIALFTLSFGLFPWVGWDIAGLWTYAGVALGMMVLSWRVTALGIVGMAALALYVEVVRGAWNDGGGAIAGIILSISFMMALFARTLATMNELRTTRDELATLAAERERERLARDIHDILGHSLTVITVKAELAGRLAATDPDRAAAEVADIERLARGALVDVRTTVAGRRGVTLSGELAAARTALDAADIVAELPGAVDAVGPAHRELAAWVLREGVTNVVRHSRATRCRVTLTAHEIEIDDDGVGPTPSGAASTGLAGLRDRVKAAGGTLTVGHADLGGFMLRVTL